LPMGRVFIHRAWWKMGSNEHQRPGAESLAPPPQGDALTARATTRPRKRAWLSPSTGRPPTGGAAVGQAGPKPSRERFPKPPIAQPQAVDPGRRKPCPQQPAPRTSHAPEPAAGRHQGRSAPTSRSRQPLASKRHPRSRRPVRFHHGVGLPLAVDAGVGIKQQVHWPGFFSPRPAAARPAQPRTREAGPSACGLTLGQPTRPGAKQVPAYPAQTKYIGHLIAAIQSWRPARQRRRKNGLCERTLGA